MKKQLAALLLLLFAFSLSGCGEKAAESEARTVYAMDTVMNLTVYGENAAAALESAEQELLVKSITVMLPKMRAIPHVGHKVVAAPCRHSAKYVVLCEACPSFGDVSV